MFSSSYFNQEYFNDHFKEFVKITGTPVSLPGGSGIEVNMDELHALGLCGDEEEILEFIVAFVLSR